MQHFQLDDEIEPRQLTRMQMGTPARAHLVPHPSQLKRKLPNDVDDITAEEDITKSRDKVRVLAKWSKIVYSCTLSIIIRYV